MKTPIAFDAVPVLPLAGDQLIRSVTYKFSVPPSTKPVFYPPSLKSEPPLPPGFPGASHSARFIAPAVVCPESSGPHLGPTYPLSIDQPSTFYGWNSAELSNDLFSGTSFYHTGEAHAIPLLYSLPTFLPSASHTEDTADQWQDLNNDGAFYVPY